MKYYVCFLDNDIAIFTINTAWRATGKPEPNYSTLLVKAKHSATAEGMAQDLEGKKIYAAGMGKKEGEPGLT